MRIGERIKYYRDKMDLTLEDLSKIIGVSRQTLSRYETGVISSIPSDRIEQLAEALHTTPACLMGWTDETDDMLNFGNIFPIQTKKFPLLGEIACGEPIFANEDRESYIEAGTDIRADFCLKCKGDSMIDARICDGDIVFIRKQESVNNGEIAAVIIENEATLKRVYFYPESGKLVLNPANPAFDPFVYVKDELDQVRILGLAVAFQSDVR